LRRTCSRLPGHIVDSKAAGFDPSTFRDRYEEALLAHLKAEQTGAVPEGKPTFAAPRRVINLMEALRRSVADETNGAASRKSAPAPTRAQMGVSAMRSAPQCRRLLPAVTASCVGCWDSQADLQTVVADLLFGQYRHPLRVVAFNTAEGWMRDISADSGGQLCG
jgi:hypothetical protein